MAVDLQQIGSRTLTIDCDVLQADGGTRTAAITGSYVALMLALRRLRRNGKIQDTIRSNAIAAVSVGIVDGVPYLDLNYEEDRRAEVDLNVVMMETDEFIELQGTAEMHPFSRSKLDQLLAYAQQGIHELLEKQRQALAQNGFDIS
jgi:ribonuclease PH